MSLEPVQPDPAAPGRAFDERRRTIWRAVAAVLGTVGVIAMVLALRGSATGDDANQRAAPAPLVQPSTPSTVTASTAPVPPRVPPVRLRIPSIGVSQDLLRLGLNADRTVQVPTSKQADQPGWYTLGPAPGQTGSAVMLGHVDSVRGPAVFYRLRELTRGDRVDVDLRNGDVAHFTVRKVATYPNERFPARKVYASHGYPALQLITCGGAYDRETGYTANVVVYTRLVGTST